MMFSEDKGVLLLETDKALMFRDCLFKMNTRRFGAVMEILIKRLIRGEFAGAVNFDLLDIEGKRIEVKFSRAEKRRKYKITERNVIEAVLLDGVLERYFPFSEVSNTTFDCNIQQVKPNEFDILFYGVLFLDRALIFCMDKDELYKPYVKYSDKQHKGNVGEGQFHINNKTLPYHLQNNLLLQLSYLDVYSILKG